MSEALLEELINKHNFIVKVGVADNDELSVTVDFAGRKQAYYRVVADEEGNVYGLAYWSSIVPSIQDEELGEILPEEFIPLNKIIIRLYILCDIFRQCREMDLSHEIVRFNSETGEFKDLLDLSLSDDEVEEEKILETCMSRVLNDDVDVKVLSEALEKDGLLHNFNLLRGSLV